MKTRTRSFKDTHYGDLSGQIYEGDIDISSLSLTSLEGSPKEVKGNFLASYNKLVNLDFAPSKVEGEFNVSFNNLKTLNGTLQQVASLFNCSYNFLENLDHLPQAQSYQIENNNNEFLNMELEFRLDNKDMDNELVKIHMFEKTKYKKYLSNDILDIFLVN